ncbi:MAG: hypothetical protein CMB55_06345 [Euryarchaeota archaeon]|nr:hypothetical protein [Euryarchaeota archaeon]
METYVYAIIGLLVLIIAFLLLRSKKQTNFEKLKTVKSGRDTINAINSNVNTGSGDQDNN